MRGTELLGRAALKGGLWLVTAPVRLAITLVRFWGAQPVLKDAMPCGTCGSAIALLGLWQCPCGYNFYGWYFSRCEVCGDLPAFIDCARCGASTMNPTLFG